MASLSQILNRYFPEKIAHRGYEYFNEGRVEIDELDEFSVKAVVSGSYAYFVEIHFSDELWPEEVSCECPYFIDHNICKHIAAVLYEINNVGFFYSRTGNISGSNSSGRLGPETPVFDINSIHAKDTGKTEKQIAEEKRQASANILKMQYENLKSRISPLFITPPKPEPKTKYRIVIGFDVHDYFQSPRLCVYRQRIRKDGSVSDISSASDLSFDNVEQMSTEEKLAVGYILRASYSYYHFRDENQYAVTDAILNLLTGKVIYKFQNYRTATECLISSTNGNAELIVEKEDDFVVLSLRIQHEGKAVQYSKINLLNRKPLWVAVDNVIINIVNLKAEQLEFFIEKENKIKIHPDYAQYFEKDILPGIAGSLPVSSSLYSTEDINVSPVKKLFLEESESGLIISLKLGYGSADLPYSVSDTVHTEFSDNKLIRIIRDRDAENAAWSELTSTYVKIAGVNSVTPRNHPLDYLFKYLPQLRDQGFELFGEENISKFKVNLSRPRVSFSVTSGVDWFDLTANVEFGDTGVELEDLIDSIKHGKKYLRLSDGSMGILPEEWINRLSKTLKLGSVEGDIIRFSKLQATALDAFLQSSENAQRDDTFVEHIKHIGSFTGIKKNKQSRLFKGKLRDYQKAAVDWMYFLQEFSFGGILADDMGLGKTIEVLAMLAIEKSKKINRPTLIAAPTSVVFNWLREAETFVPSLKVLNHTGTARSKAALDHFDEYDVIVTSYGILLRDYLLLSKYHFHYLILDESQKVKNPDSKTSRLLKSFASDYKLCLTGTPVENNLNELWSQMTILNYGMLGSLKNFQESFVKPIQQYNDAESLEILKKAIYPFILRRTKEVVAAELPPKTEVVQYCDMEPEQKRMYALWKETIRKDVMKEIDKKGIKQSGFKIIEGLLRLRQICNHPVLVKKDFAKKSGKFEEFKDMVLEAVNEGHKVLVFSQFVAMLDIIRKFFVSENIKHEYLTGSTVNREECVTNFQTDSEVKAFLISLKAGGFGLNLTAADYVFHYDPWWNPAVEAQATDRAHRIGQDKKVFIYKFITKDSVEEKILQLQQKKKELVKNIFADTGIFKDLTKEDIQLLFE